MTEAKKLEVAILMGSDSDLETMKSCQEVLKEFGVASELRILSAHRTPEALAAYMKDAEGRGLKVYVAAAGMAAHLAGAVSSKTVKPVIGVPLDASPLGGLDALLSTVQMPAGIPVATVAIGKAGAKNAGFLALQILAVGKPELAKQLEDQRRKNAEKLLAKNETL